MLVTPALIFCCLFLLSFKFSYCYMLYKIVENRSLSQDCTKGSLFLWDLGEEVGREPFPQFSFYTYLQFYYVCMHICWYVCCMEPIINLKYAALEIEREGKKKTFLHRINKSQLLNTTISGFPCSVCVRVPVYCVNLIGFSQQSLSCVPVLSLWIWKKKMLVVCFMGFLEVSGSVLFVLCIMSLRPCRV